MSARGSRPSSSAYRSRSSRRRPSSSARRRAARQGSWSRTSSRCRRRSRWDSSRGIGRGRIASSSRVRNRAPLNAGRGGARRDDGRAPARRALIVRLRQRQREATVRILLDGRHRACAMDVEPQSLQRHPRIRVGLLSPSLARLLDHAAGEARAQRSKHDPEDRHDRYELDQRVAVIAAQAVPKFPHHARNLHDLRVIGRSDAELEPHADRGNRIKPDHSCG